MLLSPRTARTPHARRRVPLQTRFLKLKLKSKFSPNPAGSQSEAPRFAFGAEHLFAASRDALMVVETASDRIVRWNPAAEQLLGYTETEILGRSAHVLMPLALARLHRERMAHYRRSGEAEVFGDRPLSVPLVHRSGNELRVEMSVTPLDTRGDARSLALLTFRDASCHQQVELASLATARADSARHELANQLRDCRQLLSQTMQEIAEPVARVRRAAARLGRFARERDAAESERVSLLAQVVEARSRDVEQTLERIATIAEIQSGTYAIQADRVNLVPLIARVVGDSRSRAPGHRLKLSAPQGLTAICDAARIESVVADLIQRAVRRNPRGCWIDVDLRRPLAGVAQIEVRDYGRRLTARGRDRLINDRGWFIDQHILAQHGGTLSMEVPREGGLRVTLNLPTHRGRLVARASEA
jgi:PAS domain S-box-containing protein